MMQTKKGPFKGSRLTRQVSFHKTIKDVGCVLTISSAYPPTAITKPQSNDRIEKSETQNDRSKNETKGWMGERHSGWGKRIVKTERKRKSEGHHCLETILHNAILIAFNQSWLLTVYLYLCQFLSLVMFWQVTVLVEDIHYRCNSF